MRARGAALTTLWALWRGTSLFGGERMAVIRPADNKTPCHKSPQKAMALRLIFAHSVRARAVCCSEGGLSHPPDTPPPSTTTRFVVGSKRPQLINESNFFNISLGLADVEQTLARLFFFFPAQLPSVHSEPRSPPRRAGGGGGRGAAGWGCVVCCQTSPFALLNRRK